MPNITNTHIDVSHLVRLPPPRDVKAKFPITPAIEQQVLRHRRAVELILSGADHRMMVVTGPCSIHDKESALEYGRCLVPIAQSFDIARTQMVIMRLYFQKPRTTTGWKGLFVDPFLSMNGGDIRAGAYLVREIALEIVRMGLPIATEALDQWMIQYIDDLVSWCCIGARTVESQPHRELASALSTPVGMKNPTNGDPEAAINAIQSANHPHGFLGMDQEGRLAFFPSTGNPYAHMVLRGGGGKPNYDQLTIERTVATLNNRGLLSAIVIDASHDNSIDPSDPGGKKNYRRQRAVVHDIVRQRIEGNEKIVGFMTESNLAAGRQDIIKGRGPDALVYGMSVTDACEGIDDTELCLRDVAGQLGQIRPALATSA